MTGLEDSGPRFGFARTVARRLLGRLGLNSPPVPMTEAAQACNLRVVACHGWPDSVSGILLPQQRLIGFNARHHRHRQRFTVAHEIGHDVLAHPKRYELYLRPVRRGLLEALADTEEEDADSPIGRIVAEALNAPEAPAAFVDIAEARGGEPQGSHTSEADQEANAFAGELLVPLEWLKADWKETRNLAALAGRYHVSTEVISIRVLHCRLR